jgi:membrane protein
MRWKDLFRLVKETAYGWQGGPSFQFGAALAFYASFALAPTLIIAIAVAGLLFGKDAARGQVHAFLEETTGAFVAKAIADTLTYVHVSRTGWTATLVGVGFVLFAATGMFAQLQMALNSIWGVQNKPGEGLWGMLRGRFFAFLLLMVIGALLLLLLAFNTGLVALETHLPDSNWSGQLYLWEGVNWLLLLGLQTLFFAMTYKLLPDVIITWRDVWIGAAITAVLFALGNYLMSKYLCRVAGEFAYGPAGSLVVVMLWVYYSSQVVLFGAEFTKHFANKYGRPMRPADYAMCRPGAPHVLEETTKVRSD